MFRPKIFIVITAALFAFGRAMIDCAVAKRKMKCHGKKIILYIIAALFINFGCAMINDAFGIEIIECKCRLDTEEGYFGYIINKKEHEITVQVYNMANVQLIHSEKVQSNGHSKMRLPIGLYCVDVINPSGYIEHFTLCIKADELVKLEGPWVVEIEEGGW